MIAQNADTRVAAATEFLCAFHAEVNDSQVGSPDDYIVDAIRLLAHIDGPTRCGR